MNDLSSSLFNVLPLTTRATIQGGWWGYSIPSAISSTPEAALLDSPITTSTKPSVADQSSNGLVSFVDISSSSPAQVLPPSSDHSYNYGYYGPSKGFRAPLN